MDGREYNLSWGPRQERKGYQRAKWDVKTKNALNPRMPEKRRYRTYLKWYERTLDDKIAIEDKRRKREGQPRRNAGQPTFDKRYRQDNNRWQARKRIEALDRWIDQDDRINNFMDDN